MTVAREDMRFSRAFLVVFVLVINPIHPSACSSFTSQCDVQAHESPGNVVGSPVSVFEYKCRQRTEALANNSSLQLRHVSDQDNNSQKHFMQVKGPLMQSYLLGNQLETGSVLQACRFGDELGQQIKQNQTIIKNWVSKNPRDRVEWGTLIAQSEFVTQPKFTDAQFSAAKSMREFSKNRGAALEAAGRANEARLWRNADKHVLKRFGRWYALHKAHNHHINFLMQLRGQRPPSRPLQTRQVSGPPPGMKFPLPKIDEANPRREQRANVHQSVAKAYRYGNAYRQKTNQINRVIRNKHSKHLDDQAKYTKLAKETRWVTSPEFTKHALGTANDVRADSNDFVAALKHEGLADEARQMHGATKHLLREFGDGTANTRLTTDALGSHKEE